LGAPARIQRRKAASASFETGAWPVGIGEPPPAGKAVPSVAAASFKYMKLNACSPG
jgi:hypothetical protein